MHPHSAHDGCVIGDAGARPDLRLSVGYDHSVIQVMVVGIDVGVIGNRAAFVDHDFAPVVQQDVFVDYAIVFNGQVVAVGNFHAMKNLHVFTNVFEHMFGNHGAHPKAQPVIDPHRGTVKH